MIRRLLPLVSFFILFTACALPSSLPDYIGSVTATPTQTATPQPTPTVTASPTPLPAQRIMNADEAIFTGDYVGAIQENQLALNTAQDDETRAAALYGLGRGQYYSGDYQSAERSFSAITSQYSQSNYAAGADFFLGKIYDHQEKYAQAAQAYQNYVDLRPGVLDAFMEELRGDTLMEAQNPQDAISAYQLAIKATASGDTGSLNLKIGEAYAAMGDNENAIRAYMGVYDSASDEYLKAEANLLAGRAYLAMNIPEQAYARFQDSVNNFPLSYDSYSALVALVENGVDVDELNRGLVDYYAGQYGVAIDAFNRYMATTADYDGTPLHYKALSLLANGQPEQAVAAWSELITNHPTDARVADAYQEKAYAQWAYLDQFDQAAQTLLTYVNANHSADDAAQALYDAGRILERNNELEVAASTWQRLIDEYPQKDISSRALFLAGICEYRLKNYSNALLIFQRYLVLAVNPQDQAAAYLWIGKTQQIMGDNKASKLSWEQAAGRDPTNYYSERAEELLQGRTSFYTSGKEKLDYDLNDERRLAELWIRTTFNLSQDIDLDGQSAIASDPRYTRGNAFWEIDQYAQSVAEFDSLNNDISKDPTASFQLLSHLVDLGYYRQAIQVSRQILDLAGLDDSTTFTAPVYFNHIRFGVYFKDIVVHSAASENLSPLFLLSVIRQESMFDATARSSAGARGLMQLIPSTGQEVASSLGWPSGYTSDDLNRPIININLGTHYLGRQRDYFDGDFYTALAAYNSGPGNAATWAKIAGGDQDLFLEVVRAQETRDYIMQIAEFAHLYSRLYDGEQ
jgi:soluble lytic murein transglycosylase